MLPSESGRISHLSHLTSLICFNRGGESRGMCPAAASHRQHPEPASTILANPPLSAEALLQSVPQRLQEPARRQSPGRDLQPRVLQTAGHQVGVRDVSDRRRQAAGRQKSVQAQSCNTTHTLHAQALHTVHSGVLAAHGYRLELFYLPAVLRN